MNALAKHSQGAHSVEIPSVVRRGREEAHPMLLFRRMCFRLCLPQLIWLQGAEAFIFNFPTNLQRRNQACSSL